MSRETSQTNLATGSIIVLLVALCGIPVQAQIQQQLLPLERKAGSHFGIELAFFKGYLLVGVPGESSVATRSGAIEVFEFDGGTWRYSNSIQPSQKLEGDQFGRHFSVTNNQLIVRGYFSFYVFDWDGNRWTQSQNIAYKHDLPVGRNPNFLVTDEHIFIAIGTMPGTGISQAIDIYQKTGDSWTFNQQLMTETSFSNGFGDDMCSFDDNTIVITDRKANSQSGEVSVFTRREHGWELTQRLVPESESSPEHFGDSIACFEDEIVVHASRSGSTHRFRKDGGEWEEFGRVVYAGDNRYLGPIENLSGRLKFLTRLRFLNENGQIASVPAVVMYKREDGDWVPDYHVINPFPPETGGEGTFGITVAESVNFLAVSAPMSDHGAEDVGSVYVESYVSSSTALESFETVIQPIKLLELYPLPVEKLLTIKHPWMYGRIVTVRVVDLLGRSQFIPYEALNSQTVQVETSKLVSGLYGILICSDEPICVSATFIKR